MIIVRIGNVAVSVSRYRPFGLDAYYRPSNDRETAVERLGKAGKFGGIALLTLALRYAPSGQILETSDFRRRAEPLLSAYYSVRGAPR